jgi:hypothetical protein
VHRWFSLGWKLRLSVSLRSCKGFVVGEQVVGLYRRMVDGVLRQRDLGPPVFDLGDLSGKVWVIGSWPSESSPI